MNKVILIGNLTRDPELRSTSGGTSVCSFSIAVNRRFAGQSGERATDFFNIVAWRQLGENCSKYLAKGRKVCVVGELQSRTYDAKDGTKRTVVEIVADDIEFLTPREQSGSSSYNGGANTYYAPSNNQAPNMDADGFADISDDELPF